MALVYSGQCKVLDSRNHPCLALRTILDSTLQVVELIFVLRMDVYIVIRNMSPIITYHQFGKRVFSHGYIKFDHLFQILTLGVLLEQVG